ncbi:MFS general substrate transporter [Stereum hirsutum FP-91666 SS1]|uniref:MFS general substrate transporter n=1 Tax=Stereum hirsutum (strain FP-91666) TaxID=721885 RepID=UPI000441044F|nr:MFS general substrate transporter [Stereum hirsutum FP-91666 SS1]EIM91329.1 MFS general substrate transporter [Stereum hirsutum FP-91666 SS1]
MSLELDSKTASILTGPELERGEVEVDHRKLLRRIDLRILPWIYMTYLVVRLDIANISNAGIMNQEVKHSLRQELALSAQQWTWVIACFYYTYLFTEPVSTFFIKITSPSIWIARIMISWGIILCCQAAVRSYGGLVTTRVLLGVMEGGYFPCIVYHWSFWYSPKEMVPRILALYAAGAAANAVSGFLAYAISFTDRAGFAGWRWLFIIEGAVPVIMGIATFWVYPDFPETSKWLSRHEVQHITDHLHKSAPNVKGPTFSLKESLDVFRDPVFYFFTAFWILHGVGVNGISTVLPVVIDDLGFTSSAGANLLNIPPAAASIVILIICHILLQKFRVNAFPLIIFMELVVLACFVILITRTEPGVRYFALVLVTGVSTVAYPVLWPRRVQSVRGTAGSALAIGIQNASAQFSGILGPQLFRSDYGPLYDKPFEAACGLIGVALLLLIPAWWLMDGDISRSKWLVRHVQSQTKWREGDDVRDVKVEGETKGVGLH